MLDASELFKKPKCCVILIFNIGPLQSRQTSYVPFLVSKEKPDSSYRRATTVPGPVEKEQ
jgi:hypothetical protein